MKVLVTKQVNTEVEIDVEFPIYYEHDLCLDRSNHVIYGMITGTVHTSITVRSWDDTVVYEMERELIKNFAKCGLHNYLTGNSISIRHIPASEYDEIKKECLEFLKKL